MATAPAHHTWQPSTPCRISIALSGGGHRAAAWALGTLYGLLAMRDAEARKEGGGVPIEFTAVASVSGGSLTNGVLATGLADLGVDLDDVTLDDFRRVTGRLLTTVATTGLIPAKGPTRRYLTGALAVLTLTVAAVVATVVAVCTAARGTPGLAWLLPLWLGIGALVGIGLAVAVRHVGAFVAVLVVAAAGALTWEYVGDSHGDAAWIAVLALLVGTVVLLLVLVVVVASAGGCSSGPSTRCSSAAAAWATCTRPTPATSSAPPSCNPVTSASSPPSSSPNGTRGRARPATSGSRPRCGPRPRCRSRSRRSSSTSRASACTSRDRGDRRATPRLPSPSSCSPTAGCTTTWATSGSTAIPSAVESAILPPSGAANFLVVANAGKDIGWQSLGRAGLLWRELRGLKRDVDVVYDVSTSQRRRTLLRLFREAEEAGVGLVGVIAHMPTTPLDVCAAFTGQADRGARADETRIVLNNMHEHWAALASSNADVPTTLGALSVETTVDLVLHAAALVTVSGYVVHGLGTAQPPTRAEVRAWVEAGAAG